MWNWTVPGHLAVGGKGELPFALHLPLITLKGTLFLLGAVTLGVCLSFLFSVIFVSCNLHPETSESSSLSFDDHDSRPTVGLLTSYMAE